MYRRLVQSHKKAPFFKEANREMHIASLTEDDFLDGNTNNGANSEREEDYKGGRREAG